MKINLLLIASLLLMFACKTVQKEETNQPEATEITQTSNVQKVELSIDGMTCTGCESAIQKTIDAFEGVYSSKADHQSGMAIIEIDSLAANITTIEEAINELGYNTKGHKILPE